MDKTIETLSDSNIENKSGWYNLDKIIGGLKKQDLILVGGRPSQGKTAFALSLAIAHEKEGGRVGFFSLEMPKESIAMRRLSIISGVEASKIFNKETDKWERKLIRDAQTQSQTNMLIDDTPGMDIFMIGSKVKQMVKHEKITAVFIDYVQLIKSINSKNTNREQEIAKISTALKQLARTCNIPVIALAQLSRGVEQRADKRPLLSDLRDSGQLEQDADVVLFPYRPNAYPKTEMDSTSYGALERCELLISKNRNGKTGTIGGQDHDTFMFDPKTIEYKFY